jgi:hypothetical protein
MLPQVDPTQASRVLRAVRATFNTAGHHPPQLIQNYITAPGKPCWALIWHEGPTNWAEQFATNLPLDLLPDGIYLEAHHDTLAIFPYSVYNQ